MEEYEKLLMQKELKRQEKKEELKRIREKEKEQERLAYKNYFHQKCGDFFCNFCDKKFIHDFSVINHINQHFIIKILHAINVINIFHQKKDWRCINNQKIIMIIMFVIV